MACAQVEGKIQCEGKGFCIVGLFIEDHEGSGVATNMSTAHRMPSASAVRSVDLANHAKSNLSDEDSGVLPGERQNVGRRSGRFRPHPLRRLPSLKSVTAAVLRLARATTSRTGEESAGEVWHTIRYFMA